MVEFAVLRLFAYILFLILFFFILPALLPNDRMLLVLRAHTSDAPPVIHHLPIYV